MFFLHQSGRCYKAEICTILFPLRCAMAWYYFLQKSKFSDSGQKPWTIVRRFDRNEAHSLWSFYSLLEDAIKLKFAPFCSPCDTVLLGITFSGKSKIFCFWPKTMDYSTYLVNVHTQALYPKSVVSRGTGAAHDTNSRCWHISAHHSWETAAGQTTIHITATEITTIACDAKF